jgi:hypothetical protein
MDRLLIVAVLPPAADTVRVLPSSRSSCARWPVGGLAWSALPDAPTIATTEGFAAQVRHRLATMARAPADREFEHRADDRREGVPSSATGAAILRRVILGVAADLGWHTRQLAALRSRSLATRPAGPPVVAVAGHRWLHQRLHTRRCKVCGEHYRRRLPNCPVCKTLKGNNNPDMPSVFPGCL